MENGVITDPGAPVAYQDTAKNYVASVYEELLGRSPSDAEMAAAVKKLGRGEPSLKFVRAIWISSEHRQFQVEQWATQYLGHAAPLAEEKRWIKLLRRGQGEIGVEESILTSADYRLSHATLASYVAGLDHDVLGQSGALSNPLSLHSPRPNSLTARTKLARQILTSPEAAAALARQDAMSYLGRPATVQEQHADTIQLHRGNDAPMRIAERILSSQDFYDFVNSALPYDGKPAVQAQRRPTAKP
jgi:hypothetical protein